MIRILVPLAGAMLVVCQPACASTSQPPAAQSDDAAKLAEARSIIAIMFPPAEREAMFDKMQSNFLAQMRPMIPAAITADPNIKAMFDDFISDATKRQRAVFLKRQPELFEAMAIAYMHEFSLAELKDVHAFAETPAGTHYLSKSSSIVGDPAVAKVNTAMFSDIHDVTNAAMPTFKAKLLDYLKAHPDVAEKIAAASKGSD